MGQGTPGEDCLEDFAQLVGSDEGPLAKGLSTLVGELAWKLPGLGESTSYDSSHLPVVKPAEEGETAAKASAQERGRKEGSLASETPARTEAEDSAPQGGRGVSEKRPSPGKSPARPSAPRASRRARAGRRQPEHGQLQADWGAKIYESIREKSIELEDGTTAQGIEVQKTVLHLYGGKMHAIVDNRYHLPLAVKVTPQSQGDCPMILPMYQELCERHGLLDVQFAMVDKAGDSEEVCRGLVDELGIIPIIPLREVPNREKPADPRYEFPKTVYDRERVTHLIDPRTGRYEECVPWGYDRARQAVKYRCPCERMRRVGRLRDKELCPFFEAQCGASRGGSPYSFWVRLAENWRYYCPVSRETKRWKELYKQRTTIERTYSLVKGPLELGEKRLRSLVTATAEVYLTSIFLWARAKVALDWAAPEKVGTATSHIPYRRYRIAI
jgi:hypothetical protein